MPWLTATLLAVTLASAGCHQPDPPDSGTDVLPTFYPLVDGARWTYLHSQTDGDTWTEVNEMAEEPDGTFSVTDERGADRSVSFVAQVAGRTYRKARNTYAADALVDRTTYDPGFMRFDDTWTEGHTETLTYTRRSYDADGNLVDAAGRTHTFTLEAVGEVVEVGAGTFDCSVLLRDRDANSERKRFWFAEDVGKVKEVNLDTGSIEELIDFSIPR